MGKDKVTICINNVNINSLCNNKRLWRFYSKENYEKKIKKNMDHYQLGAMICKKGVFYMSYLRYSSIEGDLAISFNIAKLYNGNNSIPKGNILTTDLIKRLKNELSNVLYIDKFPPYNLWKPSYDENNIDVIDTNENIKQRFELFKKIKVPYRRIDDEYAKDGTIYFYSGKNRSKSNASMIVYFKGEEQKSKGCDIHRLLSINNNCDVLRIEIKNKKHPLKKRVEKQAARNQVRNQVRNKIFIANYLYEDLGLYNMNIKPQIDVSSILRSSKYDKDYLAISTNITPIPSYINKFSGERFYIIFDDYKLNSIDTALSTEYQSNLINDFIKQCGFDKIITTKDKLYKIIDNSNLFTKTKRKTAKRIIRCLNGEIHNININIRTVEAYKKLILKTGYHYLYADNELKPISADEILMAIEHDKFLNMTA